MKKIILAAFAAPIPGTFLVIMTVVATVWVARSVWYAWRIFQGRKSVAIPPSALSYRRK